MNPNRTRECLSADGAPTGYNVRSEVTSARGYAGESGGPGDVAFPNRAFDYAYDPIGNRTSAATYSPSNDARVASYTANALNQYTAVTVPGSAAVSGTAATNATVTLNDQPTWRYRELFHGEVAATNADAPAWQEARVVAVVPGQTTNTPDVVSSVTGHVFVAQTPETFAYDDDGNLTSDGRFSYVWDAENRLIAVETLAAAAAAGAPKVHVAMTYDHQSRRIGKSVSVWTNGAWQAVESRAFLNDGWNLLAETTTGSCGAGTNLYAWALDLSGSMQGAGGIGGLASAVLAAGRDPMPVAYAYDANGNVMQLVTTTNGLMAAAYEYDPFGTTVAAAGCAARANAVRFSSKYLDEETGLFYYGYRYLSPVLGRWGNRDPSEEVGGVNIYSAFYENPCVYADLLGNWNLGYNTPGALNSPVDMFLYYLYGDHTQTQRLGPRMISAIEQTLENGNSLTSKEIKTKLNCGDHGEFRINVADPELALDDGTIEFAAFAGKFQVFTSGNCVYSCGCCAKDAPSLRRCSCETSCSLMVKVTKQYTFAPDTHGTDENRSPASRGAYWILPQLGQIPILPEPNPGWGPIRLIGIWPPRLSISLPYRHTLLGYPIATDFPFDYRLNSVKLCAMQTKGRR